MIGVAIGWPGTGKTQALVEYVRAQARTTRFVVFDRAREWDAESPRWRTHNGLRISVITDMHRALNDISNETCGVWLVRPPHTSLDAAQLALDVGDTTFVDDEMDLSARNGAEGMAWEDNPIRRIVHEGRHLVNRAGDVTQVNLLGAARRPQSMHPDVTAIAEWAMIFRVAGALTLKRLQSDAWIDADDWNRVRNLPDMHYLQWPGLTEYKLKNPYA